MAQISVGEDDIERCRASMVSRVEISITEEIVDALDVYVRERSHPMSRSEAVAELMVGSLERLVLRRQEADGSGSSK